MFPDVLVAILCVWRTRSGVRPLEPSISARATHALYEQLSKLAREPTAYCVLAILMDETEISTGAAFPDVLVAILCVWRMRNSTSLQHCSARAQPRPDAHALYRDHVAYCVLAILMAEEISETSVKISKNEVGCRDDTVPKTVETRRYCEEDLEHATIFCNC